MEYVEGQSLKDRIASGPLSLDEAIHIAIQVAEGLHETHEKAIIHRHIKDAIIGPHRVLQLTQAYIALGEYDEGIDQIEYLLSIHARVSVPWLRMDPWFDPLREQPRFLRLLEEYSGTDS